ncbi:MAG TPA: hypothetical protein DDZ80_04310 [Cyanobacteria bacterium UBA8803]|nr:hypothetical protein [Cyanobacteria bacterium UBA9273]HBL57781.1 hypothetical protein [Cyanobacteria bacterium UBA8803]
MPATGNRYPMRALIKHKAKAQLRAALASDRTEEPLDERLLEELAATLFHQEQNQAFAQPCISRAEADEIENRMAADLVQTYRDMKQRQKNPLVEQLNRLL